MRLHRWTPEELHTLHQLQREGATHAQIAAALNMPIMRVKNRICWEGKGEDYKAARREKINTRRNATGEYRSTPRPDTPSMGAKAPAELLEDAKRRLLAPRTISQQLMGDPPQGYSALDRKRQNVPESQYIDARLAQLQRRPSLPGAPA